MSMECPAGFALYSDIIMRLGDVRPTGRGVKFQCLFPDRHKHGDRNWSGYACIGANGNLIASCRGCGATWPEIKAEVGLPGGAWFPHKGRLFERNGGRATTPRRPAVSKTTTYDYRDEDGVLLFQKLRVEDFDADGKRIGKRFLQRRPLDRRHYKPMQIPEDAGQVWVWGMTEGEYGRPLRDNEYDLRLMSDEHQAWLKLPSCRYVLYRLPDLLAANPEHPVFLVEGEKDVETLRALGFVATCTVTAGGVPDPEWFVPLEGRRVVVVADNDCTGKRHTTTQAGILVCGGARSVRVLWPGEAGYDVPAGGDLTDWLRARATTPDATDPLSHEAYLKWPGQKQDLREGLVAMCKMCREYRVW